MEDRCAVDFSEKRRSAWRCRRQRNVFVNKNGVLDAVISTVGLDWDPLWMGMATAPIGFEAMGDWSRVVAKVKRFDEITPSFTEIAALKEMRARSGAEMRSPHGNQPRAQCQEDGMLLALCPTRTLQYRARRNQNGSRGPQDFADVKGSLDWRHLRLLDLCSRPVRVSRTSTTFFTGQP